jgi:hypothetical protein
MSEGVDYELMIGTKKVSWVFVPMYNGTPSKLEWVMQYSIDTCVDCSSWDMSKIQYCIYDYNADAWETITGKSFHLFYGDFDGNQVYVGHLTNQVIYYLLETSVSNYISDDGYVKIGIDFAFSTDPKESEIHYVSDNSGSPLSYVGRTSIIRVFYNGLFIS